MGKVPTASASEMKRKKKTGPPTKNSSTVSSPINFDSSPVTGRRSARRNPRSFGSPFKPEFDEDDDERKEKKVKRVGRLPEFEEKREFNGRKQQKRLHSRDQDLGSVSGSDTGDESDEQPSKAKKRRINVVDPGSGEAVLTKVEDVTKATDVPQDESPLESGPTTPLPDKKLLAFILDRLQKKDTRGAFSEPVDINELPDYFEVVEKPMDFGTIKKKLDSGDYRNLEQLEADVYLICSNAMLYNSPDTVFYRKARAIQELAKRDFQNLRHEGVDGEPQPKVVRRGRPPSKKNLNTCIETSPVDRVQKNVTSDATLATAEDMTTGSSGYNLRKAPALNRFRASDQFVSLYRQRNGENSSELSDWNHDFPASILRADMKYGKKQLTVDESRRNTYTEFLQKAKKSSHVQVLVPVGFQEPLVYARSLARFAADLGPVAWKIASKRIESSIPAGLHYEPGWVDDIEASNSTDGDCQTNKLIVPSKSELSSVYGPAQGLLETFMKNKTPLRGEGGSPWRSPFPAPQHRNGFNGILGSANGAHPMLNGISLPSSQTKEPSYWNGFTSSSMNHMQDYAKLGESRDIAQTGCQVPHGLPGILNAGSSSTMMLGFSDSKFLVSSPSSGPQIGSSQQPDLALQL